MTNKRINIIINYIKQKKEVKFKELCTLFPEYNSMTIRRDLILLEKNGVVKRFWGGAKLNEDTMADFFNYNQRSISALKQKRYIAVRASTLLKSKKTIYLDAGTTMLELAKIMPDISLFIVTNGPTISLELQKSQNIDVILTGGSLNKSVLSLSGPIALDSLDKINIDTAFIGAAGFSLKHGFTNALYNECELKKKAISLAKNTIVLIDSSKIGKSLPYTFANISDIHSIVTDKPFSFEIENSFRKAGIEVIY